MDARVKRFRAESERHGAGGVGRRYPAELKAVAVAVAQERRADPLARVASDLGVSLVSLQRWIKQGESARFRPVQVELESSESVRGLVLITPRGYRVEGLETESLACLLRVLG
jgi:transposase-like protein